MASSAPRNSSRPTPPRSPAANRRPREDSQGSPRPVTERPELRSAGRRPTARLRALRLDAKLISSVYRTRPRPAGASGQRHRVVVGPVDRHLGRLRIELPGGSEAVGLQVLDGQRHRGVDRQIAQPERRARFEDVDCGRLAHRILARPHQPVALHRREGPVADGAGRRVGRMGRDVGASGGPVGVAPAVVLAAELGAVVGSDGEADPAVQAAVLPHVDEVVVGPPHRELPAQQLAVVHVAVGQVVFRRHRMPQGERVEGHRDRITSVIVVGRDASASQPSRLPRTVPFGHRVARFVPSKGRALKAPARDDKKHLSPCQRTWR